MASKVKHGSGLAGGNIGGFVIGKVYGVEGQYGRGIMMAHGVDAAQRTAMTSDMRIWLVEPSVITSRQMCHSFVL
jgi:hypothetical protein